MNEKLYEQLGGARRVLARYVDREIGKLGDARDVAMGLLKQMLAKGGNRQPAQRLGELAGGAKVDEQKAREVLEKLVGCRLVEARGTGSGERKGTGTGKGKKNGRKGNGKEKGAAFRLAHDLVGRAVWDRLEEQEARDIDLRETARALVRQVPQGRLGKASWFGFGLAATTRDALLEWGTRGAPGGDKEDKAFVTQVGAWARGLRRAKIAAALTVIAVVVSIGGVAVQARKETRAAEVRTAMVEAERELERDPGKALAWLVEAARLQGGVEGEPDRAFHEQWLLAREAWSEGVGWVAADHGNEVVSVAFSPPALAWMETTGATSCEECWPNRKLVVSAAKDGSVRVLDLEKGGVAEALPGGGKVAAWDATFSPDGRWVAACDLEGVVRIWDAAKRGAPRELRFPARREGRKVAFSYDGRWIAAGTAQGTIAVWQRDDKDTWASGRPLGGHDQEIKGLAFSPREHQLLASCDASGKVLMTDVRGLFGATEGIGAPLLDVPGTSEAAQALAFSSEGDTLGVAIGDRALLFGRPPGESEAKTWALIGKPIEPGSGTVVRLLLAGRLVVTGAQEGDVIAWQRQEAEWQRRSVTNHGGFVWGLSSSRDLRSILSTSNDGSVRTTSRGGIGSRHLRAHQGRVVASALSPDGLLAATGGLDGHVRLWSSVAGRQGFHYAGGVVQSLAVEDPAKLIIGGLRDGQVLVWPGARVAGLYQGSLPDGVSGLCLLAGNRIVAGSGSGVIVTLGADGQVAHATRANEGIRSVLCTPDGTIVTGHEHSIQIRRQGTDDFFVVGGQQRLVLSLALAPDGHTVVSGSMDNHLRLWDLNAASAPPLVPKPLADYDAGAWVTAVAALDARDILFGTADGRLHRWHGGTGRLEGLTPDHHGALWAIALRGGLVATAGEDGLLLRWLDDGVSRPLRGHLGAVRSALFSLDGDALVSGGGDYSVRVWPLPPRDRRGFASWLAARAPWSLRDGVLRPAPIPRFEEIAGAPTPRLDPACIAKCRAMKAEGTLSKAGETMESCVLIDMCNGHDGN